MYYRMQRIVRFQEAPGRAIESALSQLARQASNNLLARLGLEVNGLMQSQAETKHEDNSPDKTRKKYCWDYNPTISWIKKGHNKAMLEEHRGRKS